MRMNEIMSTPVDCIDAGATAGEASNVMTRDMVTAGPTTIVRQPANLLRGRHLLELLGRGAIAPSPRAQRWTLEKRGERKRPHVGQRMRSGR